MAGAGVEVYLQFGEVQWWYFCPPTDPANGNWTPVTNGGMPFYDAYTTSAFQAQYGAAMHVFTDPSNDPAPYPARECVFAGMIGAFTAGGASGCARPLIRRRSLKCSIRRTRTTQRLTEVINFPSGDWTPANLACLKTENFTYTGNRDLDQVRQSVQLPATLGFPPSQASHLVGIGDYTTPWSKEWSLAMAAGLESIVLFALDQFCLIGYPLPLDPGDARSGYMGS